MDWSSVAAPRERILLAQALVRTVSTRGLNRRALAHASNEALSGQARWREVFRGGPTEAVWFISEVSDASMAGAFSRAPAASMAAVIETRFRQNSSLKPFVWQVMIYDLMHPLQALARMQRTARVMFRCVDGAGTARGAAFRLTSLNLVYTGLVFIWLLDRTLDNRRTRSATVRAMHWLGI